MGDFSRKHKLKDFITQAKRNGWVTTPDEQKKMECIYKMSDEKDGCTDEILNRVYDTQVWDKTNRDVGWNTFIWSRVFDLYNSSRDYQKISKESFDEYRKYKVSEHSQEDLDKIHRKPPVKGGSVFGVFSCSGIKVDVFGMRDRVRFQCGKVHVLL